MTGFINVNKSINVSSAVEVAKIKKLTGMPCGHMGTLDPMASGVLPVAIGNATRLFEYFLGKKKKYSAVFRFGYTSDTLDTTGNLTKCGTVPAEKEIESVLPRFIGETDQIPPIYSAKNVGGRRSYQLARDGAIFELPPKRVTIFSLKLKERISDDEFAFEIECGGGTYIRSLARDIAKALETYAVMSSLTRTASGVFTIENAVKTECLDKTNINDYIIKTQDVLPYDCLYATEEEAKKLFNGLTVKRDLKDGIYKIFDADGEFYGLCEAVNSNIKVRTKLC